MSTPIDIHTTPAQRAALADAVNKIGLAITSRSAIPRRALRRVGKQDPILRGPWRLYQDLGDLFAEADDA